MAYVDASFNTDIQETVIGGGPSLGVNLGTVTASATQTYTGAAGSQVNGTFRLPIFKNPVSIKGIRVYCNGAAGGGVTGITLGFYNGTTLIGSCAAPAVNSYADVTIVASTLGSNGAVTSAPANFTGTASNEVIMIDTATGTASGSALGSYSIDFIWRNLFTT